MGTRKTNELFYYDAKLIQEVNRGLKKTPAQSDDKFAQAFYIHPDIMAFTTLGEGRYLEINAAFEKMSGYKREEIIGCTARELDLWVDLQEQRFILGELFEKGYVRNRQIRLRSKWSEIKPFLISMEIINIDGMTHILSVLKDISNLRHSEEALRQSEERFYKAFHASPVMMTISRLDDGVIVDANQTFLETLGYPPGKVIGHTFEALGLYNDNLRREDILGLLAKSGLVTNHEGIVRSGNGQVYTCLISLCIIKISGKNHVLAHGVDITERKQVEVALKESQQQMKEMIDFLPDATLMVDKQGQVIAWNRAMEEMTGVKAETILGQGDYQYALPFYGDRRPIILDLLQSPDKIRETDYSSIRRNKGLMTGETYCPTIGSSGAFIQGTASLLYDSRGSIAGAIESIRDISLYKQTLESLRQSEERFYKAFQFSPMMMVIVDLNDWLYIEANQMYLDTIEYSREEIIGHSVVEVELFMDINYPVHVRKELKERGVVNLDEHLYRTRSGKIITVKGAIVAVSMNGMYCGLATLENISEKKEMESNLARLDQLNLVGEMAASIGHEIRNPMTSIRGFLQMLSAKDEYARDIPFFNLMIEELDRANAIISEFLGMAKNKRIDLQLQYLDDIVKSMYPMIKADANYLEMDIELVLGKPPIPLIDAQEVRQLILNMARNGLEAMSPGGILTIGTQLEGNEIVLYIKDQGSGIDPQILGKLGTPFTTTKEAGTGLGLAVCYSIAARHNARINFETGLQGTTFYVRFPIPFEQASLF